MHNELLLIASIVMIYGGTLLWYRLFGKSGLYVFTAIATIASNIEVLILINAFGMEQTLGNVLFAATFLITDILSELYGKEDAKKAVNLGIATSISFILLSQSWLLFQPSAQDIAMPHMKAIFSNTPRLMFASLLVYAISQKFDVWAYHKWWSFTERICGDKYKYLWLRNNGSTLLSQILNTGLFSIFAFGGIYDIPTLLHIAWSSYLLFIVTSLADTPVIYLARRMGKQ